MLPLLKTFFLLVCMVKSFNIVFFLYICLFKTMFFNVLLILENKSHGARSDEYRAWVNGVLLFWLRNYSPKLPCEADCSVLEEIFVLRSPQIRPILLYFFKTSKQKPDYQADLVEQTHTLYSSKYQRDKF